MKLKFSIILALLAAECSAKKWTIDDVVNRGNNNEAFAKECRGHGQGRRCRWDDKNIDLDGEEIVLTVETRGPKITCYRNHQASKPGAFVGRCNGAAQSANFIKRQDKNGNEHIYGSIVVAEEICHMSKKEVSCEPASSFPDEEEAEAPSREDDERDLSEVDTNLRGSNLDLGVGRRYNDAGGNLDVMVVWTKDAECMQSGYNPGCSLDEDTEFEMRALISLAVAETNTAFTDSGITTQLRLVHAYRDDTYVEPTTRRYKTVISNLQRKNDGELDSVHIEREKYGADFVAMIIGGGGSCGIAYSGSAIYASKMFSVTRYSCTTGYYSFGHEIAHNAGCFHDRTAMDECSSSDDDLYGYGWRDPNANFRSIMAYNCNVGGCDDNAGGGCPRVQMFSNPAYQYDGQAIGDSTNDNRRVFNKNKRKIAGLFPAMDCQNEADCDDGNSCTRDSCGSNGACVHDTDYAICAQSCPKGQKNFQLYLDTDNSGHQISWSLVNDCTGSTVHSGSGYRNNKVYNIDECVDEGATYTFTISDRGSNGLCCSNGYGEYTALYDGLVESKGTSFGSSDVASFGGTCSTPSPTPSLEPSPWSEFWLGLEDILGGWS